MPEGFLPPVIAELRLQAGQFFTGMAGAQREMTKTASVGSASFNTLATVGKAALLGVGTAAVGLGTVSVKLADEFEKSHARLTQAIKNTGSNFDQFAKPIGAAEKQLEKFGFTNNEVEASLATLTAASHKPATALKDIALAADVARGRHISLEEATNLLAKVETGHVALLGRMGIATKDATGKTISQEEALRRLTGIYGGQARAASETFAGKMTALKATSEDLAKNLGQRLIPVIEAVVSETLKVVEWFERHRAVAIALGVGIGTVLVAAIGAYTIAMITAAAATIAAAAPVLAIIAAVALLGVGIFELATHWSTVWAAIKNAVGEAVDWIKAHFVLISLAFGPLGIAAEVLLHNWEPIWKGISAAVEDAWKIIKPIFDALGRAAADVAGAVGKVATVAKAVGGVLGHIPGFADGGYVPGPAGAPQLAIVHGGEYVVPRSAMSASRGFSSGGGAGPSGGGMTNNFYITGGDSEATARAVRDELLKMQRRGISSGLN